MRGVVSAGWKNQRGRGRRDALPRKRREFNNSAAAARALGSIKSGEADGEGGPRVNTRE